MKRDIQNKDEGTELKDINFVDDIMSWAEAKRQSKRQSKKLGKPILILHKKDNIKCKPFLVSQTISRIELLFHSITNEEEKIYSFDEVLDKRRVPTNAKVLAGDFYIYNGVFEDKKYLILSNKKLENNFYNFYGTIIRLQSSLDIAKKNLKNLF